MTALLITYVCFGVICSIGALSVHLVIKKRTRALKQAMLDTVKDTKTYL